MTTNPRQQRLLERVQEDERLRGDLAGEAATALVAWASAKVRDASADQQQPDAEVEQAVLAIRQAARASASSGETDPATVIALAENLLGQQHGAGPQQAVAAVLPVRAPIAQEEPAPKPTPFGRIRHPWRERIRRWFKR